MKHIPFSILTKIALCGLFAITFTSCDNNLVYDEEGDCDPHYFLKFVFDKNMHYNDYHGIGADAFAAQVGSVDVYLFDPETEELKYHIEDFGDHLRQYGYELPLEVEPGKYEIIAWCGLNNNEDHFSLQPAIGKKTDLACKMYRKIDTDEINYSDICLNPLFHGSIVWDMPDEEGNHYNTVYLTKDTNYIQLAMQHRAGALDPEQFTITMEDENGYLAHDNSLLKDNSIEYRPWSQRGGVIDLESGTRADEEIEDNGTGFLVAELATSRLMSDRNPILKVTDNETGDIVFSLPLVQYVLMMKSQRYSTMPDQEYLDREDEYEIMVFLENKDKEGWLAATIVINGWHVVDNGNVGL